MKKLKHFVAASLIAVSASASATLITFNELAFVGTFDGESIKFDSVTSGGFLFSNSFETPGASKLGVWGRNSTFQSDPGFASVFVNWPNTRTTMTEEFGRAFDFNSIELADVFNKGESVTIDFTLDYFAGGFSKRSVKLDELSGLQTFTFDESALRSVTWVTTDGNGFNQFDNVVVNGGVAPIPEPETYAMMLAGLGLLGAVARKRGKTV